jgi:tRNA(Arg) A34 adenosine deaminase TadA
MCAAAHGWVGLGRIVYACSSKQLSTWLTELNVPASRVRPLPIGEVITGTAVDGPVEEFADDVHSLHVRFHRS